MTLTEAIKGHNSREKVVIDIDWNKYQTTIGEIRKTDDTDNIIVINCFYDNDPDTWFLSIGDSWKTPKKYFYIDCYERECE